MDCDAGIGETLPDPETLVGGGRGVPIAVDAPFPQRRTGFENAQIRFHGSVSGYTLWCIQLDLSLPMGMIVYVGLVHQTRMNAGENRIKP
jgi:hypothetical protein